MLKSVDSIVFIFFFIIVSTISIFLFATLLITFFLFLVSEINGESSIEIPFERISNWERKKKYPGKYVCSHRVFDLPFVILILIATTSAFYTSVIMMRYLWYMRYMRYIMMHWILMDWFNRILWMMYNMTISYN